MGDTEETLAKIKLSLEANNSNNVVGMYSPLFCSLDNYDYKSYINMIRKSGANIVWTSLGAPKQDIFSSNLLKHSSLMG